MGRLNKEIALERIGRDEAIYLKIVGYFLKDYGDYSRKAGELIEKRDYQAYVMTHSLKNIAASLGAEELSRRALELEILLKAEDFFRAGEYLPVLLEEFYPVLEEVRSLEKTNEPREQVISSGEEGSFLDLLNVLEEGLGSFSPDRAEEAMKLLDRRAGLIPAEYREVLEQIRELAGEFRYLEAEEILLSLRDRL
ncbi:MAG: Hpt domain-containing protein [Spirochaetales bacterium]|nr:Hpt domain-containing protein [Spirochaetales bacterium]